MALIIEARAAAPFYKNGFVLACDTTRQAILVDPGDEVEDLLQILEARRLSAGLILLTHAHMDHVSGVARAKRATGARIGVHRDDAFLQAAAVQQGLAFGYQLEQPPPPDFDLASAGTLAFGACEVRVHHTPGRSPGGVCLHVGGPGVEETHLFVGDTLFAGSIGRTDLPGGDYATLIRSIRDVLFGFGDAAIVHAGHGPVLTAIRLFPSDARYLPATINNSVVQVAWNGHSAQVSGQVVLPAESKPAGQVWVAAVAYDEAGRVVGVRRWEGRGIQPGGYLPFRMTVSSLGGRLARVEFAVEARP